MQKKIIAAAALVLTLTLLFVSCGKGPTIVTKEGYEYPLVTDEEGNTVVDENGDLVIYVTDENGKYVEDANGEPQTNSVTFPDKIVGERSLETAVYSWQLPEGWAFDETGKAVKDGSDGNIYIKVITVGSEEERAFAPLFAQVLSENQEQAKEIQKTYPDTVVESKDVTFSAASISGKSLVFQIKDDSGKVMHYVDGIYFVADGVIYKIEYACLNGYYDETVDLYTILQSFTVKTA